MKKEDLVKLYIFNVERYKERYNWMPVLFLRVNTTYIWYKRSNMDLAEGIAVESEPNKEKHKLL